MLNFLTIFGKGFSCLLKGNTIGVSSKFIYLLKNQNTSFHIYLLVLYKTIRLDYISFLPRLCLFFYMILSSPLSTYWNKLDYDIP